MSSCVGLRRVAACILLLLPSSAVAQDAEGDFDPYPLRPADTSSPRDTLRSFNASINEAMQAWQADRSGEAVLRPGRRALETFDFSQVPERGRLAKEIDRKSVV